VLLADDDAVELARLCAAFGGALGAGAPLRADADFFAAGGTSLAAAVLCARLALPLQALLEHPTPRVLACSGLLPLQAAAEQQEVPSAAVRRDASGDAPLAKRLRLPPLPETEQTVGGGAVAAPADAWAPAMALSFACRCDAVGSAAASNAAQLPAALPAAAPSAPPAVELACAWRVPLRACVDASPLVLLPRAAAEPLPWRAVIGSHAHTVTCVEFDALPPAGSSSAAAAATRVVWSTDVGCASPALTALSATRIADAPASHGIAQRARGGRRGGAARRAARRRRRA
jgi:hypothetical protein